MMSEKNPFKSIPAEKQEPAPEKVVTGLKSDLSFIRFIMHIADLYLGKLPDVVIGYMEGFEAEENPEEED